MFGGLCFLVGGNMAAGIVGEELMLRVGPDALSAWLERGVSFAASLPPK